MSATVVQIRREPDLSPCDTELPPVINTRYLAVHMGNAPAGSALDGHAATPRRWGLLIAVAFIPALGALALGAEYLRWILP